MARMQYKARACDTNRMCGWRLAIPPGPTLAVGEAGLTLAAAVFRLHKNTVTPYILPGRPSSSLITNVHMYQHMHEQALVTSWTQHLCKRGFIRTRYNDVIKHGYLSWLCALQQNIPTHRHKQARVLGHLQQSKAIILLAESSAPVFCLSPKLPDGSQGVLFRKDSKAPGCCPKPPSAELIHFYKPSCPPLFLKAWQWLLLLLCYRKSI